MESYRDLVAFLVCLALFALLLRMLRPWPLLRRLTAPLLLFALAALLWGFESERLQAIYPQAPRILSAAALFFALFLLIRLFEIALFEHVLPRRTRRPVPVMLRDILRMVLSAAVLVWVIKKYFPTVNFSALAVSSIIIGYIIGNATQETLGNLIAGLALNSENSFSIGDWITVQGRTGRIANITWRSTRILTRDLEDIIIPNSTLSREIIINHSRPTPELRARVRVGVSYDVPPNRVRETVLDTLRSIPTIEAQPSPSVRVVEYADFAVMYDILFFIREFERLEETRAAVMNLLWYRFKRDGIAIPFPIRDVRSRMITINDEQAEIERKVKAAAELLERQPLFAPLRSADRLALAARTHPRIFAKNEAVVQEGRPGTSLFIVKTGRLRAEAAGPDGRPVVLAEFQPGDLFGEWSFLTGEPRSATVLALEDSELLELDKAAFTPILKANLELAEELGRLLAQRATDRSAAIAASQDQMAHTSPISTARHFMNRILDFFGLPSLPESSS